MKLMLSDHDLNILLAGTLMNWGYPFSFGRPHVPDANEEEIINSVIERFRHVRRDNHEQRMLFPREVELTTREALSLIAILEACLKECRGNSVSIHLHLHAENEDEVRELANRLRRLKVECDHRVALPEPREVCWYCPLLQREILEGLCLDINYQLIHLFRGDELPEAQRETGKTVQEIASICEACPNQPLREG
jgi:hypothetical protein